MGRRFGIKPLTICWVSLGLLWTGGQTLAGTPTAEEPAPKLARHPDILIVTVDTLRVDRVSAYGYERPTTPHIDALLERGVRFTQARVPEPLTAPAMVSMVTGLFPHEHGTSRNGLRMRPGLASFVRILERQGYETAAFVGNWTLKNQLSGLAEHFGDFNEVFTRKRWVFWFSEATAEDLTSETLAWIEGHLERSRRPYLAWVHYVEPHAPYQFQSEVAPALGIGGGSQATKSDRYDTEVAFVDRSIGGLLAGVEGKSRPTLIFFASDHGESLGEHNYWGHGRHLYDATLHVPMGLAWEGEIEPRTIDAPASLLDLAPTVMSLVGLPVPPAFRGFDWSPVFAGTAEPPSDRVTHHQAHKGAVQGDGSGGARRKGLLAVGRIAGSQKEILRTRSGRLKVFDLSRDPGENRDLAGGAKTSAELEDWLGQVREGLTASDELPPPSLDEESLEQLKALGYIDE